MKVERIIKEGWAIIGGRICDYAYIARNNNPLAAYAAIKRSYTGGLARQVWNGLVIYLLHGIGAYYYGIDAA
jgi:hypothetical protein